MLRNPAFPDGQHPSRREDRRRLSVAKAPKGFVAREGRRHRWLPELPRKPKGSEACEARPTAKRSGAGRACEALRETNAKPKAKRAGSRSGGTRQGAALDAGPGKPQACGAVEGDPRKAAGGGWAPGTTNNNGRTGGFVTLFFRFENTGLCPTNNEATNG